MEFNRFLQIFSNFESRVKEDNSKFIKKNKTNTYFLIKIDKLKLICAERKSIERIDFVSFIQKIRQTENEQYRAGAYLHLSGTERYKMLENQCPIDFIFGEHICMQNMNFLTLEVDHHKALFTGISTHLYYHSKIKTFYHAIFLPLKLTY